MKIPRNIVVTGPGYVSEIDFDNKVYRLDQDRPLQDVPSEDPYNEASSNFKTIFGEDYINNALNKKQTSSEIETTEENSYFPGRTTIETCVPSPFITKT